MKTTICAAAVVAAFACVAQTPASAACITINTAAQLQAISNHLDRDYCLGKDIDLSSIANFTPIATEPDMFTGTFDGGGHVIRNLKMNRADQTEVGLFGNLNGATIKNLTLENVAVANTKDFGDVGALAGLATGATTITNVRVSGQVALNSSGGSAGGFIGWLRDSGVIAMSSSSIEIGSRATDNTGGLVGTMDGTSTIRNSYANGLVFCEDEGVCGGLVGAAQPGIVIKSFATGEVICGDDATCGGAIGFSSGSTRYAYSSGTVLSGSGSTAGGLIGQSVSAGGVSVDQSFSVGLLGGQPGTVGGLIGLKSGSGEITNSFWDKDTSGLSTSAGGSGRRTVQFQKIVPAGLDTTIWSITRGYSYPYLKAATHDLKPQLATLVKSNGIFTFLPISELDKTNYTGATNNVDEASLANCYTMIARTIGTTLDVGQLQDVKTDRYFWTDATRKTTWRGPVTTYAMLGALKPIAAAQPLTTTVIVEMKKQNLVLLRGRYKVGAKLVETWMLGTLYSTTPNGAPAAVFAHDPATGQQVQINPVTKKVVSPAHFQLTDFTVIGYRPVTISLGP